MLFCSVFLQDAYVKYSECVHQIMSTLLKDINSKGKIDSFFHEYIYFILFFILSNYMHFKITNGFRVKMINIHVYM